METATYILKGTVIRGSGRGKSLGFPTANISLTKHIPQGIYRSKFILGEKEYSAITYIGAASTFGENEIRAETHILNFKDNIYNKVVVIELFEKIREPKKFDSSADLENQIKEDIRLAESYFK